MPIQQVVQVVGYPVEHAVGRGADYGLNVLEYDVAPAHDGLDVLSVGLLALLHYVRYDDHRHGILAQDVGLLGEGAARGQVARGRDDYRTLVYHVRVAVYGQGHVRHRRQRAQTGFHLGVAEYGRRAAHGHWVQRGQRHHFFVRLLLQKNVLF